MRESVKAVLTDVLQFLEELVKDEVDPEEAFGRLPMVRARHPESCIDLVWEEQAFDGSLHYDALIRSPTGGTVSLSVCPDRALPWPLRGVQRWRDSDLVKVNGTVLSVAQAIAQLEVLWQDAALMQHLVDGCLIEEALKDHQVEVSAADIQEALDGIRRRRGLLSAAETRAWMAATGTSLRGLEQMATDVARAVKLRELIVGDQVEAYITEHADAFDLISIAQLQSRFERAALELAAAVRNGAETFLDVAQRAFLKEDTDGKRFLFRRVRRYQLEPEIRHAIHGAIIGSTIGPIETRDGFLLIRLLSVEPAELHNGLRTAVMVKLFDEWLGERRRAAKIEWFWGKTQRTAQASVSTAL